MARACAPSTRRRTGSRAARRSSALDCRPRACRPPRLLRPDRARVTGRGVPRRRHRRVEVAPGQERRLPAQSCDQPGELRQRIGHGAGDGAHGGVGRLHGCERAVSGDLDLVGSRFTLSSVTPPFEMTGSTSASVCSIVRRLPEHLAEPEERIQQADTDEAEERGERDTRSRTRCSRRGSQA